MADYPDLLKIFEEVEQRKTDVVLPRPLEEIFPEQATTAPDDAHRDLMKKDYEDLVSSAFQSKS